MAPRSQQETFKSDDVNTEVERRSDTSKSAAAGGKSEPKGKVHQWDGFDLDLWILGSRTL